MPKKTIRSETSVVTRILKYLNAIPDCLAEKQHGSMYGHQKLDILGCYRGYMFWIEVKRLGEEPTKLQLHTLDKWRTKTGCFCIWVDNFDDCKRLFDSWAAAVCMVQSLNARIGQ
jgi:hypothetical protein